MLYKSDIISQHLSSLGLKETDTVMIHGNSGIAAQYIFKNKEDSLNQFISHLIKYFRNGTILVPTYTYSATDGDVYLPQETPARIGLFSEAFRKTQGVTRSNHPIFSVGCIGKEAELFLNTTNSDCFGEGTFFEKIFNADVKILTLGCGLETITFAHFVEQKLDISYRYFKEFYGRISINDKIESTKVRYFVRDLNLETDLELTQFENSAINQNKLIKKPFGRMLARIIKAKDFFRIAEDLIKKDEFSLIKEQKK